MTLLETPNVTTTQTPSSSGKAASDGSTGAEASSGADSVVTAVSVPPSDVISLVGSSTIIIRSAAATTATPVAQTGAVFDDATGDLVPVAPVLVATQLDDWGDDWLVLPPAGPATFQNAQPAI